MKQPSPTQIERAKRLLAYESAAGSSDDCGESAGRVYEKIHTHLGPLVGFASVQALLGRSAKLTQSGFSFLEADGLEGAKQLREWLRTKDPAIAIESAAALFGTFLEIITTFIGDRLTTQVLRNAWPKIEETGEKE